MSKAQEPVFLFLGIYDDPEIAQSDLSIVRDLHDAKIIGTYDAGIATKDVSGNVKISRAGSEHGGWTGAAAGAVVGLLFPPAILGMAAVGGATGGLINHFTRGLSRSDVKDLGDLLDEGQAALIVLGKNRLEDELDKAGIRAAKRTERKLEVDASDLETQLSAAAAELDTH